MSHPTDARASTCVVAGGGPAGMVAGLLLARAGVQVTVLEKHDDFFRDFRGDTVHPATLEVMHELGLLDELLELPHTKVPQTTINVGGRGYQMIDFRHLPTVCKFLVIMPQWDFLNFLAEKARRYPGFTLEMGTRAVEVLRSDARVTGVRARNADGEFVIQSDLVIAADGRDSTLRASAGLRPRDLGSAIDVLWWRLPKHDTSAPTLGYLRHGQILVTIDRGDYYQCGAIVPKGAFDRIHARGLAAFRASIARTAPPLASVVGELTGWDAVKLLSVQVNRLRTWHRPGLLFIGDAAHAMSPAGGVGVNYAIQDAVAAANAVAVPLREGRLRSEHLEAVRKRRYRPVSLMQAIQVRQARQLAPLGDETARRDPIRLIAIASVFPPLKRIMGRVVGLGFRREHVTSPDVGARTA
ncbi:FAD-dependent oxidoreductase [Micromonospora sp. NPDC048898]|uniref:FAD-dependent oxidoreductase n=1 Tax=Micromonospora sp. NPDC048898 TaxID=3364260 RepID=UPI00371B8418